MMEALTAVCSRLIRNEGGSSVSARFLQMEEMSETVVGQSILNQ